MPRHSTDYSLHSPSSSDSMAARPRPKSSSKSLPSLHQLISDDIPSNGHDASKPNHPKTGGKCIGLIESMSDESTSSSESEEEDDGDSDDDEPDVLGPAGLTQDTDTTITAGSSSSKKRAFDDADLTLTLDDFCTAGDDTDFPRKRISLDMSESLMPSCNASTVGDTEDDYAGLDLLDDDGMDGLLGDEEELENEEVAAIIQEIEQQDKDSPNSFLLDSEDMAQFELAEDLNSELFSAEWESSNLLFNHITSDNDIDLFNVHLTTAESTPAATPKGSDFSSAFPPATPLDSCTDNNDISSEDDIFDFNALFDRPSKQIAAYASNMASLSDIDIDSDDAELAKYFFSSEDSGNETDREDDSDDGMSMCFPFYFFSTSAHTVCSGRRRRRYHRRRRRPSHADSPTPIKAPPRLRIFGLCCSSAGHPHGCRRRWNPSVIMACRSFKTHYRRRGQSANRDPSFRVWRPIWRRE